MNRMRMLAAMVHWSIELFKYGSRGQPIYRWRKWKKTSRGPYIPIRLGRWR